MRIEIGGVTVAQPQSRYCPSTQHLCILSVLLAANLRESVGRNELVAEPLSLFLIAGNTLSQLQAHVLQAAQGCRFGLDHRARHRTGHRSRPCSCPAQGAHNRIWDSASAWRGKVAASPRCRRNRSQGSPCRPGSGRLRGRSAPADQTRRWRGIVAARQTRRGPCVCDVAGT